jgi:hypothetical protein
MKILIDINHPAHVHLFRNFAKIMETKGHKILFTTREKEVTLDLLQYYKLNYISLGKHYKKLTGKIIGLPKFDYLLYKVSKKFNPDIFLSMASIYASHVSFLLNKDHIAFEDSEPVPEHQILYVPFTKIILTPEKLKKSFGKKQIRYNGYNELAYLHPNYFKAQKEVYDFLNIKQNERFAILRFVSFNASHDIGIQGFSNNDKLFIVKELEKYGKVFISSEKELPQSLENNRIKIPPHFLHSALYYSSAYLGDSQTMATEAAILGTPSVRCNSFPESRKEMSNFEELEIDYGILYNFNYRRKQEALMKTIELFKNSDSKIEWSEKRRKLLSKKIDVTAFMVWFVENYPESAKIMKKSPDFQKRFK